MPVGLITLGKEGVVSDIDQKIDYLMCCFFFSKYSQSTIYRGKITSLSKMLQLYGNDAYMIKKAIESGLYDLLAKAFTTVSVTVTATETASSIDLQLEAIVSDTSSLSPNSRSIGYSLTTKDSMLKSIVNLVNGETLYTA